MPLFYYFLVSFFPVFQCIWGSPTFTVRKYVAHSKSVTGGGISYVRPLMLSAIMEARGQSQYLYLAAHWPAVPANQVSWEHGNTDVFPNEVLRMEVVCKLSRDLGLYGITLTSINTIPSFSLYRFGNWYQRDKTWFSQTHYHHLHYHHSSNYSARLVPTTDLGTFHVLGETHVIFRTTLRWFLSPHLTDEAEAQRGHTVVSGWDWNLSSLTPAASLWPWCHTYTLWEIKLGSEDEYSSLLCLTLSVFTS